MKNYLTFILLMLLFSCKEKTKEPTAQQIIDKTIETAGGDRYENAIIGFTFREMTYGSKRKNGEFQLSRRYTDSVGEVVDILSNSGFERFVNGNRLDLADSTKTKYSNSVNSVHYFVQLPYGLNSPAVNKELVGESSIKNKDYYKIRVTFGAEGGGDDHDDIYMYWINKDEFTIDYFAYKFFSGQGGIRFREAYNPRWVEGIRFVDYKNYKAEPWREVDLSELDSLYKENKLELVSDIQTTNIEVELITN